MLLALDASVPNKVDVCVCPMGVDTAMLRDMDSAGASTVRAAGDVLGPDEVAEAVLRGVAEERFLILSHPEVLEYWRRKTADYDRWLGGMWRVRQQGEPGCTHGSARIAGT